jgi:hypothetical protein
VRSRSTLVMEGNQSTRGLGASFRGSQKTEDEFKKLSTINAVADGDRSLILRK